MNIHAVRDNLVNTIAGKEKMLASIKSTYVGRDPVVMMVTSATREFLELNINELKRILQDVEVCCNQHTEMGWELNPERMGQYYDKPRSIE